MKTTITDAIDRLRIAEDLGGGPHVYVHHITEAAR